MSKICTTIVFIIAGLTVLGCSQPNGESCTNDFNVQHPYTTKPYMTKSNDVEYEMAMADFASWRKFIEQPIDKITIISTDDDSECSDDEHEPPSRKKRFEPIEIKDPEVITNFCSGILKARYSIMCISYGEAGEMPIFRIIFTSGKQEKSIWVCSFGYSITDAAYLPCMFSSYELTDAFRATLKTHNRKIKLLWKEMATGLSEHSQIDTTKYSNP